MKQDISGYTRLAAVIATPIKHSLSPLIHNTAFQELGIDAVYLAFDVELARFEHVFASIRDLNMLASIYQCRIKSRHTGLRTSCQKQLG